MVALEAGTNKPTHAQVDEALDLVVERQRKGKGFTHSEQSYRAAVRKRWEKDPAQVWQELGVRSPTIRARKCHTYPEYNRALDGPRPDGSSIPVLDWIESRPELSRVLDSLIEYESRHGSGRRLEMHDAIKDRLRQTSAHERMGDRFWKIQPIVDYERRHFLVGVDRMLREDRGETDR